MSYLALILSVVFGFGLVLIIKPKAKIIQLLLSFSGAYLLSITVLHLIPEVFEKQHNNIGLFILLGIVFQTTLEYLSKGAEHGHIHAHDIKNKIPWLLFLSLCVHAFLEGMPLGFTDNSELLWAIVIHKVPIAIILTVFFKKSNITNTNAAIYLMVFALMSPLGSLTANVFPFIHQFETQINAIVIGVFLHISTAILFESSENHQFNLQKFITILIGFGMAFVSLLLH